MRNRIRKKKLPTVSRFPGAARVEAEKRREKKVAQAIVSGKAFSNKESAVAEEKPVVEPVFAESVKVDLSTSKPVELPVWEADEDLDVVTERAREDNGRFLGDDPATPDSDEAWVEKVVFSRTDTDEDSLRALARDHKISHWHVKGADKLLSELEELDVIVVED